MSIDSLIDDLSTHLETLENAISRYDGATSKESKDELLKRMQREISYIEPKIPSLDSALKRCEEPEEFQDDVNQIHESFASNKAFYCRVNEEFKGQSQKEEIYQADNDKQKGALANLQRATADGREINDVLIQDKEILAEDHELLNHIDSNVDDIGNEADKGLATGKRMYRRQKCKNAIGWIIDFILLVALLVILWCRFAPNGPLYCKKHPDGEKCKK